MDNLRFERLTWHTIQAIANIVRIGSVVIGTFAILDLTGLTNFGYPEWSIFPCGGLYVVAHCFVRLSARALRFR